eukprot:4581407-Prymnesium_polylepis.1
MATQASGVICSDRSRIIRQDRNPSTKNLTGPSDGLFRRVGRAHGRTGDADPAAFCHVADGRITTRAA